VGGYLGDRMQSLITQVEYKPLFGVEMRRRAHRPPNLRCLHQSLEREINSCPGASAGDDVWTNDGADVIITSVHETEPFAGAHISLTQRGRGRCATQTLPRYSPATIVHTQGQVHVHTHPGA
jgi:hypothetical protein